MHACCIMLPPSMSHSKGSCQEAATVTCALCTYVHLKSYSEAYSQCLEARLRALTAENRGRKVWRIPLQSPLVFLRLEPLVNEFLKVCEFSCTKRRL